MLFFPPSTHRHTENAYILTTSLWRCDFRRAGSTSLYLFLYSFDKRRSGFVWFLSAAETSLFLRRTLLHCGGKAIPIFSPFFLRRLLPRWAFISVNIFLLWMLIERSDAWRISSSSNWPSIHATIQSRSSLSPFYWRTRLDLFSFSLRYQTNSSSSSSPSFLSICILIKAERIRNYRVALELRRKWNADITSR